MPGFFQPIEVKAPAGSAISTAENGVFNPPTPAPVRAALLLGQVYRLRVTGIPRHEGEEVFPTIEVIDRLYAPVGYEAKFPVPIEITAEEMELALAGKYITRVIYVEDPDEALPIVEDTTHQRYFEAAVGDDPLQVADQLGRPIAILRLGGRVPDANGPDATFLYGCPPMIRYHLRADGEPIAREGVQILEGKRQNKLRSIKSPATAEVTR